MRVLEYDCASASSNLAFDEALLGCVNAGRSASAFRVWKLARPAVILGIGSSVSVECDLDECRRRRVEVRRRGSGGAAVLIGPSDLCATVVAAYDEVPREFRTIGGAHRLLGGIITSALDDMGADAQCAGTSDVAVGELKIAGLSQSRKRKAFLVHASILVDPDMDMMQAVLPHPPSEPDYRGGRNHREFLTSLDEAAGPGRAGELTWLLKRHSGAKMKEEAAAKVEIDLAHELEINKYLSDEWTERR